MPKNETRRVTFLDSGYEIPIKDLVFQKYRKKPVVIQAMLMGQAFKVETLEGIMTGEKGDFLIIGVKGEAYPCKPDIFKVTYENLDGSEV